jgi:hypothetical protein
LELFAVATESEGPLALVDELVVGEDDLRDVHSFPLASELQQRDQTAEEDVTSLDVSVAVVENLREARNSA